MALYDIPNLTSGPDTTLIEIAEAVNVFVPMFLVFVWGIIFIGGVIAQNRRLGVADLPLWAVMASISCLLVALPMSLSEGFIPNNIPIISILVVITILSGFWLFLDRKASEI